MNADFLGRGMVLAERGMIVKAESLIDGNTNQRFDGLSYKMYQLQNIRFFSLGYGLIRGFATIYNDNKKLTDYPSETFTCYQGLDRERERWSVRLCDACSSRELYLSTRLTELDIIRCAECRKEYRASPVIQNRLTYQESLDEPFGEVRQPLAPEARLKYSTSKTDPNPLPPGRRKITL